MYVHSNHRSAKRSFTTLPGQPDKRIPQSGYRVLSAKLKNDRNLGINVGRGLAPASGKTMGIRIGAGKFVTACCTAGPPPYPVGETIRCLRKPITTIGICCVPTSCKFQWILFRPSSHSKRGCLTKVKMHKQKNCHCEPVTAVTGVAIRIPLEMFRLLAFLRRTDSHASVRYFSE